MTPSAFAHSASVQPSGSLFGTCDFPQILMESLFLKSVHKHHVRCAGAGGCCWSGVREKYCWLVGGWRLLLEWCERKTLLVGWRRSAANGVKYQKCPSLSFSSELVIVCRQYVFAQLPPKLLTDLEGLIRSTKWIPIINYSSSV